MRILWHSNAPWATTGYGVQTALFVPRMVAAGHELAISAFWGLAGAALEWNGLKIYPADESWGNRLLPAYAAHHGEGDVQGCQVITLMDVWVLRNFGALRQLRLASWCPVDHEPLPQIVRPFFAETGATPIAMSRFGQRMFEAAGFQAHYVPHGVDTQVYQPRGQRDDVRESLGIPADAFVVGMVAMNKGQAPPRKAFPQCFEAFARLARRQSDAVLYVHTDKFGVHQGINLVALAEAVGIPTGRLIFAPAFELEVGIPAETMSFIYSAFDVLLAASYGEGFGIPIIEAQACGVPVITTDWTSMPELTGAGWTVGGERYYNPAQGSFWRSPSVREIVDALEEAYRYGAGLRDQARRFALAFDADLVMERHWTPVLAELEAKGRDAAKALVAP